MGEPAQELMDRLAIEEVLTRYAWALDGKEFDRLDDVFTPDAFVDYTSAGGIKGPFPEVKAWLASVMPHFPAYQHMVMNKDIRVDGDTATSRAAFYNPMIQSTPEGGTSNFFVGGEYHDQLVRTPQGWRIKERIEKTVWMEGNVPAVPPGDG